MSHITLTIDGAKYVAIPAAQYRRVKGQLADEREDGVAWAYAEIAGVLQRARVKAGLSQGELAKRLKKSQTLVSRAESGELKVSERYMTSVLKACGLPDDWTGA